MHGSEHPFWSNPVAQMGPNVEQNYENMIEMGTNWVRCDGILSHTLGPLFKPWYHKGTYCPHGLPVDQVGRWYTRRFHLCVLAISELIEAGAHIGQQVISIDEADGEDPPSVAGLWLHCALFSHETILLRSRYLHLPHSYIYWSKRRNMYWTRYTNGQNDAHSEEGDPEHEGNPETPEHARGRRSSSPSEESSHSRAVSVQDSS